MPKELVFVDHYAVLGCSPSTSASDLKRAYYEKLREFHPDKRKTSINGLGHKVTQQLNEAWEILADPEKREAYDVVWQRHQNAAREAFSCEERAEKCRHEGNELYKAAQAASKGVGSGESSPSQEAKQKYNAAIAKYTLGLQLSPQDHRLRSNRALCYATVKDWTRCREDAEFVTKLKADFMKGWFLLAKATWKLGSPEAALGELETGLRAVPKSAELLALQAEVKEDLEGRRRNRAEQQPPQQQTPPLPPRGRGGASRNVSPSYTPTPRSRLVTPPARSGSKSPGPSWRRPNSASGLERRPSRSPCPGWGRGDDEPGRFGNEDSSPGGGRLPTKESRRPSHSPGPHARQGSGDQDQMFQTARFGFGGADEAPHAAPPAPPGNPPAAGAHAFRKQGSTSPTARHHRVSLAEMAAAGRPFGA